MEIERKFLINDKNKVKEIQENYNKKIITQDYIYSDVFTAIRKRKIESDNYIKYFYTIKTDKHGISVNEIEKEISKVQYELLKKDINRIEIVKDRYIIPYKDDLKIELDVFHGVYEGIIFAEIEFESEEQGMSTEMPSWFGKEIGNKISNDMMSKEFIDINSQI